MPAPQAKHEEDKHKWQKSYEHGNSTIIKMLNLKDIHTVNVIQSVQVRLGVHGWPDLDWQSERDNYKKKQLSKTMALAKKAEL